MAKMHGDAALVESIRNDRMPDSPLKGAANILVMPNMEAARISYNLLRVSSSEGVTVRPVLMGVAKPVHILTPIASVRRIVNMVALAVAEAQTEPLSYSQRTSGGIDIRIDSVRPPVCRPEQGAAVPDQIELDIAAATVELKVALAFAVRRGFPAFDDR